MTDIDTRTTEVAEDTVEDARFVGEFIGDELPKISRSSSDGVWTERLEFLSGNPGQWAKVWATGDKSPHPTVNLLRSGKAAGVNAEDYEFAGRTFDGNGFVLARLLTDEQKAERAEQAEAGDDE